MSTRDELYDQIDVSTFGGGPAYFTVHGSGSPAAANAESTWDYVDDQPMRGYWDCLYCGSLYPNDVWKCSQCGAHKRRA